MIEAFLTQKLCFAMKHLRFLATKAHYLVVLLSIWFFLHLSSHEVEGSWF
jgi:hypothetical protein